MVMVMSRGGGGVLCKIIRQVQPYTDVAMFSKISSR